ncbi:hypothetical protein EVB81_099 [Rhizobium phage RHph_I46]|uniref:Uncharacterized protein n=1 Tax=Rhizobium phage RHph_I1_9 TaxID=2509729 RepID=A0A7S5R9E9_9CAUD|nr:hypothetical protein PP936_gp098 [Rhizobium phage RHph_I1_9]QIG69668.1 hypothetical protein EVB81_099 [Rhizobium phage RHph_I46]QIG70949.1 hypothetical protein EVB92_099 [Rhizobium phage RHph_I9]QIG73535.1 hypothetical protein EVC04_098 [Rhizobium phage RHph_I1_9]QIG76288.1 hypothetical protein EVC25_099 [Rhizobium phage RHph_I34]
MYVYYIYSAGYRHVVEKFGDFDLRYENECVWIVPGTVDPRD